MTQTAQPDEPALIARSQQGDRAAFNVLVERYQALAYSLALRVLGERDTAADVTQEAFFSAFRAIASFHGTSFRAWLLRIVSNGCGDVFRARARRPAVSLDALLEAGDPFAEAATTTALAGSATGDWWDPERAVLRAELAAAIQAALLRLPAEQRTAVVLSDVQGLSYDEIAQVMETPVGTVKSRIARARAALRGLLTLQGELSISAERPHTRSEED